MNSSSRNGSFTNKVVVVTGASAGVGRAIAVKAAGDGIVLTLDIPPDGIACITLEFAA